MLKKLSTFALAMSAMLLAPSESQASARRGTDVPVNIASAKIPSGFDQSDVVAIVSGIYPNSCYSWSRADLDHKDAYLHEVKAIAHVTQGACLMVLVPFSEEIHLGAFEKGTHKLRFVNGDGTYFEQNLLVE